MTRICAAPGCKADISQMRKDAIYCGANCSQIAFYTDKRLQILAKRPFKSCANPKCEKDVSQRNSNAKYCSKACARKMRPTKPSRHPEERRAEYQKHREKRIAASKEWRKRNPKKANAAKRRWMKRRTAKASAALAICKQLGIDLSAAV